MSFLISIIAFLLVLGILVAVHELGHFLAARAVGMRVDEFAVGFKPAIFQRKRGETNYVIGAIPFGGYVKIRGEDGIAGVDDAGSFQKKSVWSRLIVVLAGVCVNFIFAYVLLVLAFSFGFQSISQDLSQVPGAIIEQRDVVVTQLVAGKPADQAGVKVGDIFVELRLSDGTIKKADTPDSLVALTKSLQADGVSSVSLVVTHEGEEKVLQSRIDSSGAALGMGITSNDRVRVPFFRSFGVAWHETGAILKATVVAIGDFGKRLFTRGQIDESVSGPVGVYQATASAARVGFSAVLFVLIVLSLNLAVLNILPIPPLDGGRALFLLIEGIFPKLVGLQRKVEAGAAIVGTIFFVLLMLILTVRDVLRLF